MKEFSEDKLLKEVNIIFNQVKRAPRQFKTDSQPARLFVSEGKRLLLDGEGVEAFNNAVSEILKDGLFSANFARRYVEEKIIQDFVARYYSSYLAGTLDIREKLKDTIHQLRAFDEKYQVIIPIGGIDFNRRSLKAGNIEIRLFRKRDFSFRGLKEIPWISSFLENLEGQVVGTLTVEGERQKAKEKALSEVGRALNLLRLYVRTFHRRTTDVQIRIMSQLMLGSGGPTLVDDVNERILYSGESPAGVFPFTINKQNLEKMKRLGFNEINSLLRMRPHEISPFQNELLLAVNWYGTAVDMTDSVLKFLNYAIVLEVLLSKQEKDSDRTITDKLAESAAFLLGRRYDERRKIKSRIKKLYGVRSSIVHGGKDFVEDNDLRIIEYYALILILKLLKKRKQFRTKQDLLDWVEEKRLR